MNAEETKVHPLDKQNQLKISNRVCDVISCFSRDIYYLISSYAITPSMEGKGEKKEEVKPEKKEPRDEKTAHSLNQKNQSAISTLVDQFIFCKDISHLIALYLVIPASYSLPLEGFDQLTFLKHETHGNLCFTTNLSDMTIHVFSKDNNWSFMRKINVTDSNNVNNRHSFAIWGNNILLTDYLHHCIRCIDISNEDFSQWKCVHLIGSHGLGEYQFKVPVSIVVVNNRCLVNDQKNFRIQCFLLSLQNGKCHLTFQTFIGTHYYVTSLHVDTTNDQIYAIMHTHYDFYEIYLVDNQDRLNCIRKARQSGRTQSDLPQIIYDNTIYIPHATDIDTIDLQTFLPRRKIFIRNVDNVCKTVISIHNRFLFISKFNFIFVTHLDEVFLQ
jgi:hypothetical protein